MHPPSGFTGRRRAVARIEAESGAFDAFENFIASLRFVAAIEWLPARVAGTEILDNLLTHGEVGPLGVLVMARARPRYLTLAFFFEAHEAFAAFAARADAAAKAGPRYDEKTGRWRGLGLAMCGNLASAVTYRPGAEMDRVFLRFDRD